jgi:uncharacterized protein YdeI (YjbR/CyaY-like superfamily)
VTPEPRYFRTPAAVLEWFAKNHDTSSEQWIGFYRKDTGKGGIGYHDALDAALAWGWIDGIRRKYDDVSYTIRFTPRRKGSNWSAVNIARVEKLIERGLMHPPGLAEFEKRTDSRSRVYSYEQRDRAEFTDEFLRRFRASSAAWSFWQDQPPGYCRTVTHFVMSAKQQATRERRLDLVIAHSANGERIPQMLPSGRKQSASTSKSADRSKGKQRG